MTITTFTGNVADVFAAGTSLEARPASNWPAHKLPPAPGTTPVGSATATAISASSGVLSLIGLADATDYYVSDSAGTRYVRISTKSTINTVAAETTARQAADTAEASSRASADTAEASARASADSSEAATRALGDVPAWAGATVYAEGDLVAYKGTVYRALQAFTSASTFNYLNWAAVPVGGSPRLTQPYAAGLCVNSRLRTLSAANMILAAAQIKGYGFTWHRDVLSWSASEPVSKGNYVWTTADREMTASAQAGLHWLPCISATPPWAITSGGDTSNFARPPTTSQDYADFVLAVWQRYGAGGAFWTANPTLDSTYAVTWLDLWNEPFNMSFFAGEGTAATPYNVSGLPDPEKYAEMCKKVGTSLRVSAPTAKVLISGEPYGNIPGFTADTAAGRWFQRVLTAEPTLLTYSTGGATGLFDGYNVHPYVGPFYYSPWDIPQGSGALQMLDPQGRFDKVKKAQRQLAEAMLKNSTAGTKEMWVTEFGWKSTDATHGVGDDAQADYLHGAVRRVFREFNNDIYGKSVLGKVFPYVLDTYAASSNDTFSITKFSSANAAATPAKALNRVQTLIRAGDSLESYGDAVLKKRPVMFCPLDESTANVVRDRSETQTQGIVPAALTRGAASLTTEPEGFSTTFDGATSTVTVPDHSAFDLLATVTLEAWVKFGHFPTATEDIIRKMSSYHLQVVVNNITGTGTTVNATNTITSITGTNWRSGLVITGTGIPAGTTILDYSGTTLTLSANATASNAGTTFLAQVASPTMATYTATTATLATVAAIDAIDVNATAGYHVVGSYDGVNQYVFVNGRLLKSGAKTGLIDGTANPVGIGWRGVSATGYFNGQLQNAAIYPRALSPREIAENYQAGKAVFA